MDMCRGKLHSRRVKRQRHDAKQSLPRPANNYYVAKLDCLKNFNPIFVNL